jgi:cytidylate kinase
MTEWDISTFEEHLGKKVVWGMLTGRSFSGKKTIAENLAKDQSLDFEEAWNIFMADNYTELYESFEKYINDLKEFLRTN